jgi:hypothetical protein
MRSFCHKLTVCNSTYGSNDEYVVHFFECTSCQQQGPRGFSMICDKCHHIILKRPLKPPFLSLFVHKSTTPRPNGFTYIYIAVSASTILHQLMLSVTQFGNTKSLGFCCGGFSVQDIYINRETIKQRLKPVFWLHSSPYRSA